MKTYVNDNMNTAFYYFFFISFVQTKAKHRPYQYNEMIRTKEEGS